MLVCKIMLEKSLKPSRSNDFATKLQEYIERALHRSVELAGWSGASGLPSFLAKRYDLFAALVGHQFCLFAADRGMTDATPAEIAKHISRIENAFDGVVIYATQRLTADRRARLVARGVPFVVPGNQLYIPHLALDLRENFHARPRRGREQFSPVAQVILFYGVLFPHEFDASYKYRTPTHLARAVGYSAMSVGRAFEELERSDLAAVRSRGRSKELLLDHDRRALIERARPLLRNPVRSSKRIAGTPISPPMKLAGESALGNITSLSPPPVSQWAMHGDDWPSFAKRHQFETVEDIDQADLVVELWYYQPGVLSDHTTVDPLSLYAQYWDNPDERVAKAAEDALDHVSW